VLSATASSTVGAKAVEPIAHQERQSHNVIFVNGDGMAGAQREAGRLSIAGLDGDLEMDKLPVSGLLTTDSRDLETVITDSAAAATAWATGEKTYNGAISVDLARRPLPVLGQQAKAAGKATGLVTTAQLTDASPAAFFSRTPDRTQQDEIARQYMEETQPDVVLGGGEDWWYPAGTAGAFPDAPPEDTEEASTSTKGDLVDRARQLGYIYVSTPEQLRQAAGPKLLGLFANEEMFQPQPEGQGDVFPPSWTCPP
jgi:alkaline phosphatase